MIGFVFATLVPVPLLVLATAQGGVVAWAVLAYLTIFTALMDHLLPANWRNLDAARAFPAAHGLSIALGVIHLFLTVIAIRYLGGPGGAEGWDVLPAIFAYGVYFGQVSHPNAHELIHRSGKEAVQLGKIVYTSMLFGHHASSHPKVHHVYVATPYDPNTALLGENFYRFFFRAWIGSFREGMRIESHDLRRAGRPWNGHPYLGYVLGALAILLLAWLLAGAEGVGVLLAIAGLAQVQILLSDYVQHYGLERGELSDGRLEPVRAVHSWNSPHRVTSAMMLNAPRHSDHHMHPGRIYPGLQIDEETMPMLPRSLPVMAVVALFPRWWRRVMNPRILEWQDEM
ncbi:alkane-1 monooxygenase, putative [Pseudooceanicola batsensis HTCC2597]|uniref:Alkane-1 monooxygenase, putative n=1 Tax=Pseudooceanicola batsensis (strain ATCC BAA-863 / DSM 15984 / KCTC 12145 / HTCC2597) TaxID=252305 RepID=A3TUK5_PSEBH|nr:alkane 1-monooxygenase [Pseudooceanicola batsensis]EAQ04201.1 alkane-1 monooxygenase, putative [Pseudooceanicola batsensis HTCC2597]